MLDGLIYLRQTFLGTRINFKLIRICWPALCGTTFENSPCCSTAVSSLQVDATTASATDDDEEPNMG